VGGLGRGRTQSMGVGEHQTFVCICRRRPCTYSASGIARADLAFTPLVSQSFPSPTCAYGPTGAARWHRCRGVCTYQWCPNVIHYRDALCRRAESAPIRNFPAIARGGELAAPGLCHWIVSSPLPGGVCALISLWILFSRRCHMFSRITHEVVSPRLTLCV